jgi:hypothetical protein
MRKYHVIYRGKSRTIEASAPYVARTFATHWLRLDDVVPPDEDFNPAEIAVIDPDEAGYGKHMGHCQGCKPTEMCSRSGTCEWYEERYIAEPNQRWPGSPAADVTDDRFDSADAPYYLGAFTKAHQEDKEIDRLLADPNRTAWVQANPTVEAKLQSQRIYEAKGPGEAWTAAGADLPEGNTVPIEQGRVLQRDAKKALAEHFLGTTMVEHIESTWSRLQQEELDKVHEIWCRRATDKGERK